MQTSDSGLTFTGDSVGNVLALRTSDGKTLWHAGAGEGMRSSPITYKLDGRQYIVTSAGSVMLRQCVACRVYYNMAARRGVGSYWESDTENSAGSSNGFRSYSPRT